MNSIKKFQLILYIIAAFIISVTVVKAEEDEPNLFKQGILYGKHGVLTDGDLTTSVYPNYTIYFANPVNIKSYIAVSPNNQRVNVRFFDSNNNQLRGVSSISVNSFNSNPQYTDIDLDNVSYIQFGRSIATYTLAEFNVILAEQDIIPPDRITGVKAESVINGINVSWDASMATDLAGYSVYVNGEKANNSLLTDVKFSIADLVPLKTYSIQVTATDKSGNESVKSNPVFVTVMNEVQEPLLTYSNLKSDSLELRWNKVGMRYEVYQDNKLISTQTHAYASVTKLEPNTDYTFYVVSIDEFYRETKSNVLTVTTPEKELVKPSISVEKVTHNSAVVKWTEVEGSEYYDFFVGGEKVAYLQSNSYTLENLTPSTLYSLEVRAYRDGKSVSAFSSFTTKKEPVPTIDSARVTIDPTDDTKRNLTYSHSNGVTAVDVYVNGQHIGTFPVDEPIQLDFSDITGKMAELEIKPVDPNGVGFKSSYPVETTGNGTIDEITNEMLGGLTTAEKAFLFLALISIPLLLLVLLFFWLRKRYKPMLLSADDKKPFAPAAATSGKANYSKAKSFSVDRTKDERFVYQPRQPKRAKVNKSNKDDNNVVNYFSYRNVGSKYNNPNRPKRNFGSNSNAVSIDKNQNKRGKYT